MGKNVDIELDLKEGTVDRLIGMYIGDNMDSASREVFERDKLVYSTYEAAGRALANDAIIIALKSGIKRDVANGYNPPMEGWNEASE